MQLYPSKLFSNAEGYRRAKPKAGQRQRRSGAFLWHVGLEAGAAAASPRRLPGGLLCKPLVQHETGRLAGVFWTMTQPVTVKRRKDTSPATSWTRTPKKKEFDTA